ncbi:MAG: nucleotidyltransferase domain-containing protein [Xanthomonadales bacterium]|nr:nucleotidyltransferase domain-containing protein [Xanthomonadales bacterium]
MAERALDIEPRHLAIVRDILARHAAGWVVWVFGSRARGGAKAYSDLDLAIDAGRPLTLAEGAALADAFEEPDLPWRVDVVDWASIDDAFRRLIEGGRVELLPGNEGATVS